MAWNGEWSADEGQQQQQRYEQDTGQQGWLGQMFTLDSAMHTQTFSLVEKWFQKTVGITGLRGYIGASTLLVPAGLYTLDKLYWLDENVTNSMQIDNRLQQAKKLQQWADMQPTSSMFSWLPTFEKLQLSKESTDPWNEDAPTESVLRSNKSRIFVFQAKLFILHTTKSSNGFDALNVRVLWGSIKPIHALLAEVTKNITLEAEAPLMVTTVWHDHMERDETVKRPLSLIDMEPGAKTWLLNDLKTFFDKDSKSYYRMSGTPYRRGYLLYGPPGSGKTSLAQAIASDYDLELFEIKLGKMTDSKLQTTFKDLPPRCVVLFEDIDAAGIGREDLIKAEADSKEAMEQADLRRAKGGFNQIDDDENFEENPELYCRKHEIDLPPEQSFVTLSGLLNTLDGPGAKEGRFVIMTTNSPRTLDKAIIRKGRMDKILYLGYSCPASAACTFKRMFGTDLTFHVPTEELERLAKRFARRIPKDLFTPCEISDYCREHRGEPRQAIRQFRQFAEDRIAGKDDFQYDIKDSEQDHTVPDEDDEDGNAMKKKLLATLPAEEPDSDSDGDDTAYADLDGAKDSKQSRREGEISTSLRVAGSPDGYPLEEEDIFAETLEKGQLPLAYVYLGWW